ncbi:MAG: GCN5-related N-acetyltransferase [Symbiobacteriaceae bacterium]|jgi:GNAT superfamily N-acetyltransferase|nr:GCN5-related N-acetyltransferase [Symbiobacteriaceae bacterium]
MLVGAAQWIATQGITQWTHYLDGSGKADLVEAISRGEVYLFMREGAPVGTISLAMLPSEWDQVIWGEAAADGGAGYVHRLAVARAAAGTGVGEAMLDWAEGRVRAEGGQFLRLDCVAENEGLNRYYARRFQARGEAANIGMRFRRWEKALG